MSTYRVVLQLETPDDLTADELAQEVLDALDVWAEANRDSDDRSDECCLRSYCATAEAEKTS